MGYNFKYFVYYKCIVLTIHAFMCYNLHILRMEVISMGTTNLNIRTDKEVKAAAERIFDDLGITMTTAVNIFLRQTIRTNGIPFELKLDVPNAVTAAAIDEGQRLAYDKSAKGYRSIADLKAALSE